MIPSLGIKVTVFLTYHCCVTRAACVLETAKINLNSSKEAIDGICGFGGGTPAVHAPPSAEVGGTTDKKPSEFHGNTSVQKKVGIFWREIKLIKLCNRL